MKRLLILTLGLWLIVVAAAQAGDTDPTRVLDPGKAPADNRLGAPKTLDDYFPFTPPATREAWESRRKEVRERVLVSTGLWPMPARAPVQAVIHGKIDRDDYTIEKVFFESLPGHFVSGNLYRPKGKAGKVPGVLSPHGHWPDGRFYDALTAHNQAYVDKEISSGAEKTVESAQFPLQARCASLARMGCVVFHYDMVGYADSQGITHREGFTDTEAELRQQSFMGMQTYNSVRALDFLLSLPEVDAKRIGVTGASGGGTQTFVLCAVDDRPTAAFPAVMVSTSMQGGCVCENCSGLRQGTGNIELAGLFAPRPLGMSGADDWTKEIETKGLPQLKALYRLYGEEDHVMAKAFLQFEHNYNQVSRELMYNWFNKHLQLGQPEPVVEKPFVPVPPKELSVYDDQHPRPANATDSAGLRKFLTQQADTQIGELRPKDADGLKKFQEVIGTALQVMVNDRLPAADGIESKEVGDVGERDGLRWRRYLMGRKGQGEQVPAFGVMGQEFDGTVVVWVHPAGKSSLFREGKLVPDAQRIVNKKGAILAMDALFTGESGQVPRPPVNKKFAGFTYGYNRPLLANRVHDILTAVAFARAYPKTKAVHLVGWEQAGPWVLLARSLCGDSVARTAADFNQFRFENVRATDDEMMLPGALKYGGLTALAALSAPGELFMHNHKDVDLSTWLTSAYQAAGAPDRLRAQAQKASAEELTDWLVR
jgi:dienelactone hydrolase